MSRRLTLIGSLTLVLLAGPSALAEKTAATATAVDPSVTEEALAPATGQAAELSLVTILGSAKSWVCEAVCGTYYAACAEDCTEAGCYSRGCGYPNGWSQGTCSCSFCF